MYSKTIKFTDFNGDEQEETFLFNLTKAEVVEIDSKLPGGIEGFVQNLVDTRNSGGLFDFICDLVKKSYGVKSPDGRKFVKSLELVSEFVSTEAYSELITELLTLDDNQEPTALKNFVNGITPKVKAANS